MWSRTLQCELEVSYYLADFSQVQQLHLNFYKANIVKQLTHREHRSHN